MRRSYQGISEAPAESSHCFKQASALLLKAKPSVSSRSVLYNSRQAKFFKSHCFKQASASTVLLKAGQVFQVALVVYTNTKERHVRTTYNADHRRPPPVEKILVTLTKGRCQKKRIFLGLCPKLWVGGSRSRSKVPNF